MTAIELPQGFVLRHPTMDDVQAVADLVVLNDIKEAGKSDFDIEELRTDWQDPDFDLGKDAWVAISVDGEQGDPVGLVVGYEEVRNQEEYARFEGDGYVHPHYNGRGIGTRLLQVMEEYTRQQMLKALSGRRVVVRNAVSGANRAACQLHENEGYHPERYYWRMEIELQAPPPIPAWPENLVARNIVPGKDEVAVFEALNESFRDHWGHVDWEYDTWTQRRINQGFDPNLWYVAWDGEQVAGAVSCCYHLDVGWVWQLGVCRPWRGLGLGLSLLQQAFGEFYRRGTREVALAVDAHNPTGATRLYERAGMHLAHEYVLYEKVLREGD